MELNESLVHALCVGDVETAVARLKKEDLDNEIHGVPQFVGVLKALRQFLIEHMKSGDSQACYAVIQLFSRSDVLPYTDEWPQWLELADVIVAFLCRDRNHLKNEIVFEAIFSKVPRQAKYGTSCSSLDYNFACYYARQNDSERMLEYVRRARFYFEEERFLSDPDFESFHDSADFLQAVQNVEDAVWWRRVWPIEEWYDPT